MTFVSGVHVLFFGCFFFYENEDRLLIFLETKVFDCEVGRGDANRAVCKRQTYPNEIHMHANSSLMRWRQAARQICQIQ